jgi:glycosyltransferase involved in cell wall biosynthesis
LRREALAGRLDVIEVPDYEGLLPFAFPWCPVVVRLHLARTTIARHAGSEAGITSRWCERRTLALHRSWIAATRHALALTRETFGVAPLRQAISNLPVVPVDPRSTVADVPVPAGPFVLYAGTVSERKGALALAEAARVFLARNPALELVYAGPLTEHAGRQIGESIRAVVGLELSARVHLLGRLERGSVQALMARARVFAFPSGLETFGLVVAEAMLAGRPVVVTRVPPFDEFVEHGQTGLLVEPGRPEELAEAVLRLVGDQADADRLGANGRAFAQEAFSLGRSLTGSLAVYRDEMSKTGSGEKWAERAEPIPGQRGPAA